MKHFRHLFTVLLLLCSTVAFAESAVIDGITYELITKGKQAKLVAGNTKYTGDIVIPESVEYNGATYNVTIIGDKAFYNCYGLTSIEIPNSVTSIGNEAFRNCYKLTHVEIPNSVTSIGNYAFYYCTGLTSVVIGNSVTSIGEWAFQDCSGLKSVVISNSVTSIGHGAFYNCSGLTSVEIPNSVTSIGGYAFYNCSGLTSVEIPNSVTSIEYYAFYNCSGLTSVEIPNSVTDINSYAFYNCTGLTSVTIGSGVWYIGSEAFAKCDNLADVYCLGTSVLYDTNTNAFQESYPEYMTLHVPAEAINSYKTNAPWSSFGTIKAIEDVEVPVCATPVVSYSNGEFVIECETEGAEFVTEVTSSDFKKFYENRINFSATYNISVYATATGYENSETVNATLCWIECECNGSDDTGVINIPATAALITSAGGAVTVSCQLNGEAVAVYTADGVLVGTVTIDNGTATIATGLSKGTIAIVKIGEKSVKVVM